MSPLETPETPPVWATLQTELRERFLPTCAAACGDGARLELLTKQETPQSCWLLVCNAARPVYRHSLAHDGFLDEAMQEFDDDLRVGNKLKQPVFFARVALRSDTTMSVSAIATERGLRRRGIAGAFYASLEDAGRSAGFRHLVGMQTSASVAAHFLRTGRFLDYEVDPALHTLWDNAERTDGGGLGTIRFLHAADAQRYVSPLPQGITPEQRIEGAIHRSVLGVWIRRLRALADAVERAPADAPLLVEVHAMIETLCEALPLAYRTTPPDATHALALATWLRCTATACEVAAPDVCAHMPRSFFEDENEIISDTLEQCHPPDGDGQ